MVSGHRGLEINEILQVIPRGLAELAQLFHAIHCHHDTGYAGSHRLQVAKLIGLCFPAASSSDSAFLRSLQIPASQLKEF